MVVGDGLDIELVLERGEGEKEWVWVMGVYVGLEYDIR